MKKSLALLIASTALTAAIGTFAWSAMPSLVGGDGRPVAAVLDNIADAFPFILASDDDDDDDDDKDDDHDDDHDDDDEDDDRQRSAGSDGVDDECDDDGECGSARNPSPAGTVAPPANGLFGNGTPPQAQVN
jgi:hypothetical protein